MTATAETETPVRKRRRRLRGTIVIVASVLVLASAGLVGAGWYFSDEVLKPEHGAPEYPLTVEAVGTPDGAALPESVTLPRDEATVKPGTWGLAWDGGQALIGAVLDEDGDSVTRAVDRVLFGELAEGEPVRLDTYAYRGDPATALGLDFEEVQVPTPLGDAPAWHTAGALDTWAVIVHGRNASREETLRAYEVYADLGHPVLAITYRNDEGAPASEDGLLDLGRDEAEDVIAAIDYAVANGAGGVVLHGISMGGAAVAMTARTIDDPAIIRGLVLDSPVADWDSTLDLQADNRDVIPPITWAAKRVVELRADLKLSDLDQRRHAGEFGMPVLLFVDTEDGTVDHTATLEFAELLDQSRTTLVESASGHTATWNEDPAKYAAELGAYLGSL
ncbi:alpha/beta hydrolase family protein [Glycomyces terrestris]|uniref:alpha/beta hydrolase family protein n=1 Tax=Glycomyces terrestris TaxID=2493553 RepID=UPI001315355B|nr:alpha/beta hydrolase [Glycomyces terrestris]